MFRTILTRIARIRNKAPRRNRFEICLNSRSNSKRCFDREKRGRSLAKDSYFQLQLIISDSEILQLPPLTPYKLCSSNLRAGQRHLNLIISSSVQFNKTVRLLLTDKRNKERFNCFRIQHHWRRLKYKKKRKGSGLASSPVSVGHTITRGGRLSMKAYQREMCMQYLQLISMNSWRE